MVPHTSTFTEQVGEEELVVQWKRETMHLGSLKSTEHPYIGNPALFL